MKWWRTEGTHRHGFIMTKKNQSKIESQMLDLIFFSTLHSSVAWKAPRQLKKVILKQCALHGNISFRVQILPRRRFPFELFRAGQFPDQNQLITQHTQCFCWTWTCCCRQLWAWTVTCKSPADCSIACFVDSPAEMMASDGHLLVAPRMESCI